MIALVLGIIVGIGLALILGRLKGRAHELTMVMLTPVFTYIVAQWFYGGWEGNVFISTPLGDFKPSELIGLETFLTLFITLLYVNFRGKRALTIDELPGTSALVWAMTGLGIGLSASGWGLLLVPGVALYLFMIWLAHRDPFVGLKARPCGSELGEVASALGYNCLTDENSLSVYKLGNCLLVGGGLVEKFPRWKEVVECMGKVPDLGMGLKLAIHGIYLLPALVGVLMGDGPFTTMGLIALTLFVFFLNLTVTVTLTKGKVREECREVLEEYAEFFRKNKKKGRLDVIID
ncbi:hypothetical protein [Thermococcus sp. GR6]|uniref:hypothetical protein n=1 Tax=Thermococcus sp. GR6 TaxID=1638256 RepID=UPI00143134E6|nr:hypothetical protein [Thermococcus sp. GR6]NJE41824.1 hypothetical protein [Thermococcus sp. GR6]